MVARKAVLKRIRITKNNKLLRRKQGRNHFNAKASRKTQNRTKKMTGINNPTMEKRLKAYFSH